MRTDLFIEHLKSLPSYQGQICHVEHIPPREARYGFLDGPLPDPLRRALQASGISELYTHQATAMKAVRDGHHVAVTTSTASGKTLCYNLPILESLHNDPTGRALYLFPTKALAQDQIRNLTNLTQSAGLSLVSGTYDGDTPRSGRGASAKQRPYSSPILTCCTSEFSPTTACGFAF